MERETRAVSIGGRGNLCVNRNSTPPSPQSEKENKAERKAKITLSDTREKHGHAGVCDKDCKEERKVGKFVAAQSNAGKPKTATGIPLRKPPSPQSCDNNAFL